MDLGTSTALVKACLCLGFLFGLLRWHAKMGYHARVEAMQSHAQKCKRQRLPTSEIGLASLCPPRELTSQTYKGCRSSPESRFYEEKESLNRFASSSSAFHRNSLFRPASKFISTKKGASLYDSPRLAHPGSHTSDEHTSWRGKEASFSNDTHPVDSGWHLVSRRHFVKTQQPIVVDMKHTLSILQHPPGCPFESVATEAGAGHPPMPFGHGHGSSSQSSAAPVDALRMLQLSGVENANTLHPPVSSCQSAFYPEMADKPMTVRHLPGPSCKLPAADALPSSENSTPPAASVDMTSAACVSLHEPAISIVFPHEPCRHMDTLSASVGAPYQAPKDISIMTGADYAPVTTSSLLGLPGAEQKQEMVKAEPVYKKLLQDSRALRDSYLKGLQSDIAAKKFHLEALQRTRKDFFSIKKQASFVEEEIPTSIAFTPLSKEEEEEVYEALNGANRHQVLVQHEPSNIDLSRAALQCLKPGAWLNDEVINLYMELLKERERREQEDYFKCHFFNTFFFNKLYKDACSYNFKAVRRWTTQKKLGYSLLECDKIFIPIHKDIHWCLAVVNIREKRLQYLDSLKGHDVNVLRVLARYIKDEAKDKGDEDLDMGSWDLEFPKDIPEQMNGCDCGMFMIKYADFLSRGNELKFTQEHMEYFRKRTTLELLQLKAR